MSFVDVMKIVLHSTAFRTAQEKLIALKIAERGDESGGNAYPSYETLARAAVCDRRRARRVVAALVARNLLAIVNRDPELPFTKRSRGCKRPNTYQLNLNAIATNEGSVTPITVHNEGQGTPIVPCVEPDGMGVDHAPNGGQLSTGMGVQQPPDLPLIYPDLKSSEKQRAPRATSVKPKRRDEGTYSSVLLACHQVLDRYNGEIDDTNLSADVKVLLVQRNFTNSDYDLIARAMRSARTQRFMRVERERLATGESKWSERHGGVLGLSA